ncbi:ABC transporter substrate-binding protein [uncultured Lactobacillus sp.]|uniref:ABC transporter substrate-binding protein n=1 Tax=uncultured Lactobacillus sp. TaxID=153152 RepID=UPI0025D99813|nr:ABC transporter substrate-binding protein [uncultured Lactobacillus sp.]
MDPKSKMNNKALRQAIGYAMNIEDFNKKYNSGLTFQIPTLILSQYGDYFDKNIKGFTYNLKKADEILDRAVYNKEIKMACSTKR